MMAADLVRLLPASIVANATVVAVVVAMVISIERMIVMAGLSDTNCHAISERGDGRCSN